MVTYISTLLLTIMYHTVLEIAFCTNNTDHIQYESRKVTSSNLKDVT